MSTNSTDHPGVSSTGDSGGSGGFGGFGNPGGSTLTKVLIFIIQPLVVVGGLLCFAGAVNGIFDVLEQLPEANRGIVDADWIRHELEIVLVYLIGMALLWGVSLTIQIYSRYLRLSVGSPRHRGDDEPTP